VGNRQVDSLPLGVIKDIPAHACRWAPGAMPKNIRFLDGAALQFLGHGQVYGAPLEAPQYLLQANVAGVRYWLYATPRKQVAVTNASGTSVHTDITHATPRAGTSTPGRASCSAASRC
jgi:hypothetical protein